MAHLLGSLDIAILPIATAFLGDFYDSFTIAVRAGDTSISPSP
jgi:hypothetical protein